MDKEITWINHAKCICMLFVYLDHSEFFCGCKIGTVRNLFLPIFVNAFFIISGYLLFKKQLSMEMITQRRSVWMRGGGSNLFFNIMWKIVIPTITFSFLLFFPKIILRGKAFNWYSLICDTLLGGSIWFTCALAVAELLLLLALFSRARNIWLYVALGIFTATLSYYLFVNKVSMDYNIQTPWAYKSGLSALLLMAFGGVYWVYENNIESFFKRWRSLVISVMVIFYVGFCFYFFDRYCGTLLKHPLNLISIFVIIIGVYILINICRCLPASRFSYYFGRHSLGLYLLSGAIPNVIAVLLLKVFPQSLGLTMVTWAISVMIGMVMVYMINRFVPFLLDLRLLRKK